MLTLHSPFKIGTEPTADYSETKWKYRKYKGTQGMRQFASRRKAEQYQNRLYNLYSYVRLVSSPMSSEEGQYVWEVRN